MGMETYCLIIWYAKSWIRNTKNIKNYWYDAADDQMWAYLTDLLGRAENNWDEDDCSVGWLEMCTWDLDSMQTQG